MTPTIQQSIPPVNGALNYQGHPRTLVPNVSKVVNKEKYSVPSQTSTVDIKPSGRNELPEGAPPGMGVPVQYNNMMSIPVLPQCLHQPPVHQPLSSHSLPLLPRPPLNQPSSPHSSFVFFTLCTKMEPNINNFVLGSSSSI
ncbi:unnamed protein product [Vicia faba]|uniref:Uncharacterized protein n=1 Tax=Vicia faba TaxID=3906 RepID=A0AAV0Z109_VICFA|nr:unnamed protein product [Vicia faba]